MGRLDHLVEAVYERFKDRYFQGESTIQISTPLSALYVECLNRGARRAEQHQVGLPLSSLIPAN